MLEHRIATGMIEDGAEVGLPDEWPEIEARILDADILVIGTPIWLGAKSSVATQVIERMYASSGRRNEQGQWIYYGHTAGCVITGNEDGVKHCAMDLLYALQHIGYMIPPQADCGWIGEAGPGPSYGDALAGSDVHRRLRQRLHEPQHHLHGMEPHAHRADAPGRRRPAGGRQHDRGMEAREQRTGPEPVGSGEGSHPPRPTVDPGTARKGTPCERSR